MLHPKFLPAALLALVTLASAGCRDVESDVRSTEPMESSDPTPGAETAAVLESLEAGPYTIAQIEVDGTPTWFAGPKLALAAGDRIEVPAQDMPMQDFESRTLGRTFDLIYFVDELVRVGGSAAPVEAGADAAGEEPVEAPAETAAESVASDFAVPEGGQTVAGLFALGKEASGSDVVFRGRVVKSNPNILGKNWLHVQDGTGGSGTNDITITTADTAEVGDTVLVKGKLIADKDFGAGYFYELIVEEASVTVE